MDKDTTGDTQAHGLDEDESSASDSEAPRVARSSSPAFLGQAMSALLQASDVQVERGDQTRVLSRANEALAEVERRRPGSIDEAYASSSSSPASPSGPPRPRVDAMLWIVLTAGLFAIVGWMLAYGL